MHVFLLYGDGLDSSLIVSFPGQKEKYVKTILKHNKTVTRKFYEEKKL